MTPILVAFVIVILLLVGALWWSHRKETVVPRRLQSGRTIAAAVSSKLGRNLAGRPISLAPVVEATKSGVLTVGATVQSPITTNEVTALRLAAVNRDHRFVPPGASLKKADGSRENLTNVQTSSAAAALRAVRKQAKKAAQAEDLAERIAFARELAIKGEVDRAAQNVARRLRSERVARIIDQAE